MQHTYHTMKIINKFGLNVSFVNKITVTYKWISFRKDYFPQFSFRRAIIFSFSREIQK